MDQVLNFNSNSARAKGRNKLLDVIEATTKVKKIGIGKRSVQAVRNSKVIILLNRQFVSNSSVIPNAELIDIHPLIKRC